MLIRLILRLITLAVAIALTTWLAPGVRVSGGALTYLWIAVIFAVVNAILGPILHLIALPLTVVTLGLFALVVNAALVGVTAWLSEDLSVGGFWQALLAAILISVFSALLNLFIPRIAGPRPARRVADE